LYLLKGTQNLEFIGGLDDVVITIGDFSCVFKVQDFWFFKEKKWPLAFSKQIFCLT
jgi:hypothetical protein